MKEKLEYLINDNRIDQRKVIVLSNRSFGNSIFSDSPTVGQFKMVKGGEGTRVSEKIVNQMLK